MFAASYPAYQHPSAFNTRASPYWVPGSLQSRLVNPGLTYFSHPSLSNAPYHHQVCATHHLPLGPTASSPYFKDHIQLFHELIIDRQRDLNLDQTIKKLLDSSRFSRRSDHTVRHIMQGRPIDKREIVRDILADRVKDQAVAELTSFILDDRKFNRTLDQILLHLQAGIPVPIPDEDESLVKREQQRRFDAQVAQELQNVLLNDFSSQFGAGLPRPWGFSTEPISFPSTNPLPYIPTTTGPYAPRYYSTVASRCPCPTSFAGVSGCSPSSDLQSAHCNLMPGQSSMMPGQSSMMPGQSSMMPGQSSMMSSIIPGQSNVMPAQSSMIPSMNDPMQMLSSQQYNLGPDVASLASAIASKKYM